MNKSSKCLRLLRCIWKNKFQTHISRETRTKDRMFDLQTLIRKYLYMDVIVQNLFSKEKIQSATYQDHYTCSNIFLDACDPTI